MEPRPGQFAILINIGTRYQVESVDKNTVTLVSPNVRPSRVPGETLTNLVRLPIGVFKQRFVLA